MQKKLFAVFLVFLSFAWFACKKVDIQFGDQFLDNGYTQLVTVDSFAANLSTVYVDSFTTSAKGVIMVGAYPDPVFGKINASSYFEVIPPPYSDTYVDSFRSVTFDSLAVVLRPDNSYIGDTTKPVRISISRLAQAIVPYDPTSQLFFNTDAFPVQPTVLGSKNVILRPNSGDSVIIRIDDNLGITLLKKFQDPNDPDIKSNDAFIQYFNGLRLSADANSQLIFGSKDSVTMRLYYKKPGLFLQSKTVEFTLANKGHQFNNITVDRSGTILQNLPTVRQINSTATANTAYTLYAAGAMTKLRFTSIRDILKLPNFAKILKATLVIHPVRGTYGLSSYTLPPELRLSSTTQDNLVGPDIYALNSSGTAVTQTGSLLVDNLLGENTSYTYDVTTYIKSIVADPTINNNGLLLIPPSPALETQFGRVIMGNRDNAQGKMQLLIVYASVQ